MDDKMKDYDPFSEDTGEDWLDKEENEFVCSRCGKKFKHVPLIVWDSNSKFEYQFCAKCMKEFAIKHGFPGVF